MNWVLILSWIRGDSSFAVIRTSSKLTCVGELEDTVAVTAPSQAYGTSTPGVPRPSARVYSIWTRLMVMALNWLGAAWALGFLSARCMAACPESPNTVGHGLAGVQGA